MSPAKPKLTILVSSTVYGIEELLDRVYVLLTAYGYDVWMSHKGTVPVRSDRTAFENCLAAKIKRSPTSRRSRIRKFSWPSS